jgi:NAD(P)-dependent dehydrogenase (short-subunit alcohol dehydrogenase family)
VAAGYAADAVAAESVREQREKAGARVTLHRVDVGDPDSCRRLVGEVLDQHGQLDYLVNNAGVVTEQRYGDITADDWQRHVAVNLSGAFYLTQAAMGTMIERRFGRIVNIGSVSATMGSPVQIAYAAAKSGLVGLTRSTARAVARKGITVNCVIPGSFDTDLSQGLALTARDVVTSMIPVGRWGRPEELAHAVRFLLDDMASYITGSVVTVDGGMSMGG